MVGKTFPYLILYIALHYFIMLIVSLTAPSKYCDDYDVTDMDMDNWKCYFKNGTEHNGKKSPIVFRENFCKSVKNWKGYHKDMVKVLGFFLGFYATTMMKRWWSQIVHLPRTSDVAMILNGVVVPGITILR